MVAAGLHGRALFVTGLCYCGQYNTDGKIDKAAVPMLAAQAGVKPQTWRKLVEVGSWIDHGETFEVHDFLIYNPSREKVMTDRAAGAERAKRSREARANVRRRNGVSSADPTRPAVPSEQNSGGSATFPDCSNCENSGWVGPVGSVLRCDVCKRVPA